MEDSYIAVLNQNGIKLINNKLSKEKNKFYDSIFKLINNNVPVIVSIDPFYLRHYENYKQYHGLNWNHYIIVIGFDKFKKEIIYKDSTRGFVEGYIHSISFDEFFEATIDMKNIYECEPEFITLEIENFYKNCSSKFFINQNQNLKNLNKFKAELKILLNSNNIKLMNHVLIELVNDINIIAQHREGNMKYYKKHFLYDEYKIEKNISNIIKEWNIIKFSLSPLRKRKSVERKLQDLIEYIEKIILLEKELYEKLSIQ